MRVPAAVFLVLLLVPSPGKCNLLQQIDKALNFALGHPKEINFDGLLGFVIAEGLLQQLGSPDEVGGLLFKFGELRARVEALLPNEPLKMLVFKTYLLRPDQWTLIRGLSGTKLGDPRPYQNWTGDYILENNSASYKGIPSDYCLMEILWMNCYVSRFCQEMMLSHRIDTGYLLSHRLFYLQIARIKRCHFVSQGTINLCALMLKEAKTNDLLGFPAHDIFLEQVVLCGLEGHSEFLQDKWAQNIMDWQTPEGCYQSTTITSKRSSNSISFGCTDHSTGLGTAALALLYVNQHQLDTVARY